MGKMTIQEYLTKYQISFGIHPDEKELHGDKLTSSTVICKWRCKHQHVWKNSIKNITRTQRGCPMCASLEFLYPLIWAEWNFSKNGMPPKPVMPGSSKKVWWQCLTFTKHEWQDKISDRVYQSYGCKICSGRQVLKNFNDLAYLHPDLAKELHPTKNIIRADEITPGTSRYLWWKCRKKSNHEWEMTPRARLAGSGCPFCSGYTPDVGITDLATTHPLIAAEWDYDNTTLLPSQVTAGSQKKIPWKCKKGHRWQTAVNNRTRKDSGSNCPRCVLSGTSQIELAIRNFVETHLFDSTHDVNFHRIKIPSYPKRIQVDMFGYLDNKKIVIEYDGFIWHKQKEAFVKDIEKTLAFLNSNYIVIRIRENTLSFLPIEHKNLYQLNYRYSRKEKDIATCVASIESWIKSH
jgi:hypothetical protein